MCSELSFLKVSCRSTLPSPRWRKLAACAQFKIHNSLPVPLVSPVPPVPPVSLVSPVPALPILPAFSTLSPVPLVPPVPPVPQFKIPLALFRAHYRFEKLFSLWCIKENDRLVFCIVLIFNVEAV